MTDNEVSIQIAAISPDDARSLFEKCMEVVATGELIPDGRLLGPYGTGGCAMLYTFKTGDKK